MDPFSAYIPMDRRQALVLGKRLPDRMSGSVLFADIVGFTPLSARISAGDTVELLNQIFIAFDEICDHLLVITQGGQGGEASPILTGDGQVVGTSDLRFQTRPSAAVWVGSIDGENNQFRGAIAGMLFGR